MKVAKVEYIVAAPGSVPTVKVKRCEQQTIENKKYSVTLEYDVPVLSAIATRTGEYRLYCPVGLDLMGALKTSVQEEFPDVFRAIIFAKPPEDAIVLGAFKTIPMALAAIEVMGGKGARLVEKVEEAAVPVPERAAV